MNNDGYTIDRVFHDGSYNDLQMWKYHKLPEVLGDGRGYEVKTEDDLEKVLKKAEEKCNGAMPVEVHLDRWNCSEILMNLKEGFFKQRLQSA